MKNILLAAVLAVGASGCAARFGTRVESTPGLDVEVAMVDRYSHESHTLSALAAIEVALNDYIKAEGKIPADLRILIPKYIAELPVVELGVSDHKDSGDVDYYEPGIIRDGVIDGTQIHDTGHWGYVHNERQVIVFVDCLHQSTRKKLWYQERGVF